MYHILKYKKKNYKTYTHIGKNLGSRNRQKILRLISKHTIKD